MTNVDRFDLLDKFQDALPELPENSSAEVKVAALIEGMAAATNLLAIFVSLYNQALGEDVTAGVVVALREAIAKLDGES